MLTKFCELNALLGKCKKMELSNWYSHTMQNLPHGRQRNLHIHSRILSNYKNRTNKKGGVVSILIINQLKYKLWNDINESNVDFLESVLIEIEMKLHNPIVVGSLYRVPNSLEYLFNKKYKELLQSILSETNKELIIGIDQNLDLLKIHIHHQTQEFLKNNLDHNLLPLITRPKRITWSSVTLIDNIYISTRLQKISNPPYWYQIYQTIYLH